MSQNEILRYRISQLLVMLNCSLNGLSAELDFYVYNFTAGKLDSVKASNNIKDRIAGMYDLPAGFTDTEPPYLLPHRSDNPPVALALERWTELGLIDRVKAVDLFNALIVGVK